ncbi:MAG: 4Fe-4S binding protein [bacterium]|nr:4Fe-4S binding protein [bacterium]
MLKNIKYTFLSLFTVFKHLFIKSVTLEYPEKKSNLPENFRGKAVVDGCVKCYTCLKVCPANAIIFKDEQIEIDMKKCIFCGNCAYYCPKKAIRMSHEYELATDNKHDLKLLYDVSNEVKENV